MMRKNHTRKMNFQWVQCNVLTWTTSCQAMWQRLDRTTRRKTLYANAVLASIQSNATICKKQSRNIVSARTYFLCGTCTIIVQNWRGRGRGYWDFKCNTYQFGYGLAVYVFIFTLFVYVCEWGQGWGSGRSAAGDSLAHVKLWKPDVKSDVNTTIEP